MPRRVLLPQMVAPLLAYSGNPGWLQNPLGLDSQQYLAANGVNTAIAAWEI